MNYRDRIYHNSQEHSNRQRFDDRGLISNNQYGAEFTERLQPFIHQMQALQNKVHQLNTNKHFIPAERRGFPIPERRDFPIRDHVHANRIDQHRENYYHNESPLRPDPRYSHTRNDSRSQFFHDADLQHANRFDDRHPIPSAHFTRETHAPRFVSNEPERYHPNYSHSQQHVQRSPIRSGPSQQHMQRSPICPRPSQQHEQRSPMLAGPSQLHVQRSPMFSGPSQLHEQRSPMLAGPLQQHVQRSPMLPGPSQQHEQRSPNIPGLTHLRQTTSHVNKANSNQRRRMNRLKKFKDSSNRNNSSSHKNLSPKSDNSNSNQNLSPKGDNSSSNQNISPEIKNSSSSDQQMSPKSDKTNFSKIDEISSPEEVICIDEKVATVVTKVQDAGHMYTCHNLSPEIKNSSSDQHKDSDPKINQMCSPEEVICIDEKATTVVTKVQGVGHMYTELQTGIEEMSIAAEDAPKQPLEPFKLISSESNNNGNSTMSSERVHSAAALKQPLKPFALSSNDSVNSASTSERVDAVTKNDPVPKQHPKPFVQPSLNSNNNAKSTISKSSERVDIGNNKALSEKDSDFLSSVKITFGKASKDLTINNLSEPQQLSENKNQSIVLSAKQQIIEDSSSKIDNEDKDASKHKTDVSPVAVVSPVGVSGGVQSTGIKPFSSIKLCSGKKIKPKKKQRKRFSPSKFKSSPKDIIRISSDDDADNQTKLSKGTVLIANKSNDIPVGSPIPTITALRQKSSSFNEMKASQQIMTQHTNKTNSQHSVTEIQQKIEVITSKPVNTPIEHYASPLDDRTTPQSSNMIAIIPSLNSMSRSVEESNIESVFDIAQPVQVVPIMRLVNLVEVQEHCSVDGITKSLEHQSINSNAKSAVLSNLPPSISRAPVHQSLNANAKSANLPPGISQTPVQTVNDKQKCIVPQASKKTLSGICKTMESSSLIGKQAIPLVKGEKQRPVDVEASPAKVDLPSSDLKAIINSVQKVSISKPDADIIDAHNQTTVNSSTSIVDAKMMNKIEVLQTQNSSTQKASSTSKVDSKMINKIEVLQTQNSFSQHSSTSNADSKMMHKIEVYQTKNSSSERTIDDVIDYYDEIDDDHDDADEKILELDEMSKSSNQEQLQKKQESNNLRNIKKDDLRDGNKDFDYRRPETKEDCDYRKSKRTYDSERNKYDERDDLDYRRSGKQEDSSDRIYEKSDDDRRSRHRDDSYDRKYGKREDVSLDRYEEKDDFDLRRSRKREDSYDRKYGKSGDDDSYRKYDDSEESRRREDSYDRKHGKSGDDDSYRKYDGYDGSEDLKRRDDSYDRKYGKSDDVDGKNYQRKQVPYRKYDGKDDSDVQESRRIDNVSDRKSEQSSDIYERKLVSAGRNEKYDDASRRDDSVRIDDAGRTDDAGLKQMDYGRNYERRNNSRETSSDRKYRYEEKYDSPIRNYGRVGSEDRKYERTDDRKYEVKEDKKYEGKEEKKYEGKKDIDYRRTDKTGHYKERKGIWTDEIYTDSKGIDYIVKNCYREYDYESRDVKTYDKDYDRSYDKEYESRRVNKEYDSTDVKSYDKHFERRDRSREKSNDTNYKYDSTYNVERSPKIDKSPLPRRGNAEDRTITRDSSAPLPRKNDDRTPTKDSRTALPRRDYADNRSPTRDSRTALPRRDYDNDRKTTRDSKATLPRRDDANDREATRDSRAALPRRDYSDDRKTTRDSKATLPRRDDANDREATRDSRAALPRRDYSDDRKPTRDSRAVPLEDSDYRRGRKDISSKSKGYRDSKERKPDCKEDPDTGKITSNEEVISKKCVSNYVRPSRDNFDDNDSNGRSIKSNVPYLIYNSERCGSSSKANPEQYTDLRLKLNRKHQIDNTIARNEDHRTGFEVKSVLTAKQFVTSFRKDEDRISAVCNSPSDKVSKSLRTSGAKSSKISHVKYDYSSPKQKGNGSPSKLYYSKTSPKSRHDRRYTGSPKGGQSKGDKYTGSPKGGQLKRDKYIGSPKGGLSKGDKNISGQLKGDNSMSKRSLPSNEAKRKVDLDTSPATTDMDYRRYSIVQSTDSRSSLDFDYRKHSLTLSSERMRRNSTASQHSLISRSSSLEEGEIKDVDYRRNPVRRNSLDSKPSSFESHTSDTDYRKTSPLLIEKSEEAKVSIVDMDKEDKDYRVTTSRSPEILTVTKNIEKCLSSDASLFDQDYRKQKYVTEIKTVKDNMKSGDKTQEGNMKPGSGYKVQAEERYEADRYKSVDHASHVFGEETRNITVSKLAAPKSFTVTNDASKSAEDYYENVTVKTRQAEFSNSSKTLSITCSFSNTDGFVDTNRYSKVTSSKSKDGSATTTDISKFIALQHPKDNITESKDAPLNKDVSTATNTDISKLTTLQHPKDDNTKPKDVPFNKDVSTATNTDISKFVAPQYSQDNITESKDVSTAANTNISKIIALQHPKDDNTKSIDVPLNQDVSTATNTDMSKCVALQHPKNDSTESKDAATNKDTFIDTNTDISKLVTLQCPTDDSTKPKDESTNKALSSAANTNISKLLELQNPKDDNTESKDVSATNTNISKLTTLNCPRDDMVPEDQNKIKIDNPNSSEGLQVFPVQQVFPDQQNFPDQQVFPSQQVIPTLDNVTNVKNKTQDTNILKDKPMIVDGTGNSVQSRKQVSPEHIKVVRKSIEGNSNEDEKLCLISVNSFSSRCDAKPKSNAQSSSRWDIEHKLNAQSSSRWDIEPNSNTHSSSKWDVEPKSNAQSSSRWDIEHKSNTQSSSGWDLEPYSTNQSCFRFDVQPSSVSQHSSRWDVRHKSNSSSSRITTQEQTTQEPVILKDNITAKDSQQDSKIGEIRRIKVVKRRVPSQNDALGKTPKEDTQFTKTSFSDVKQKEIEKPSKHSGFALKSSADIGASARKKSEVHSKEAISQSIIRNEWQPKFLAVNPSTVKSKPFTKFLQKDLKASSYGLSRHSHKPMKKSLKPQKDVAKKSFASLSKDMSIINELMSDNCVINDLDDVSNEQDLSIPDTHKSEVLALHKDQSSCSNQYPTPQHNTAQIKPAGSNYSDKKLEDLENNITTTSSDTSSKQSLDCMSSSRIIAPSKDYPKPVMKELVIKLTDISADLKKLTEEQNRCMDISKKETSPKKIMHKHKLKPRFSRNERPRSPRISLLKVSQKSARHISDKQKKHLKGVIGKRKDFALRNDLSVRKCATITKAESIAQPHPLRISSNDKNVKEPSSNNRDVKKSSSNDRDVQASKFSSSSKDRSGKASTFSSSSKAPSCRSSSNSTDDSQLEPEDDLNTHRKFKICPPTKQQSTHGAFRIINPAGVAKFGQERSKFGQERSKFGHKRSSRSPLSSKSSVSTVKTNSPYLGSKTPEKTQSSTESASTPEGKIKQSLCTPIKLVRSENDAITVDFRTPEKLKSSGSNDNLILKESVLSNFRNNLSKSPILKQKMDIRKSEIAAATEDDMSATEDRDGLKSSEPLEDDNIQNDCDQRISEAPLVGSGNHSLILQPKPDIIPCTSSGDKKSVSLLSDDDDLLLNDDDDDDGSLSLPNDDDDLLLKDDDDILGIDDTNNGHYSDGFKTSCTVMNVEISLSENEVTITDFQTPEKLETSGPNDNDKMDVGNSEVTGGTDNMSVTEDGDGPKSFKPLEDGHNQVDSDKTISDALVLSPAGSLHLDQSDNDADIDNDNDVDDDKDEDTDNDVDDDKDEDSDDNDDNDDDDDDDDDSDYTIEYDEGDSDELETNITTQKHKKVDIEILNSNSSSSQESLILAKPVVMEDKKVKSKSNVSFSSGYSAFSLDALLAEKDDIEVKNKDLLDMQKELKGDIERGGFVKVFNEQVIAEAEMLPEQEKELEKLQVTESLITEEHPGENMFTPRLFSQLFNESLKPISCGFSPGNSLIDQLLSNLQTELLADFLASGIVTMCFSKISCPEAICKWLYYIMSVHKNGLVVHGCQRLLMEIIQDQNSGDDDSPTWSPSPLDLLQIFINYGAEKDVILPEQCFYSTEQISKVLQRMSDGQWEDDANNNNNNNNCMYLLNRDNLTGVLDTLSCALQARPELVLEEITFIIEILVKAAVDNTFKNDMCHNTFQVAISSAIECYKNTSWPALVPDLCRRLSRITNHHHNRVYLIQLLPSGHRGHYIQQRLAAMFLHEEMTGRVLNECPETIQIQNLFMYVGYMKTLIKNIDLYKLSSCIMLMDMVVGNENIPLAQKAYLSKLAERINVLKGDLRDSVMMLDKTRVKDLMVRVSSKWTLMISTMGSTQRSLLPWARQTSPQKMRVETLKTQSDHESDNSDLEDDSQSNLNICVSDTVSKVSGSNAKTKVNRNKNSDSSAIGNSSAMMSSTSSVASSVISMDSDSDELPEL